VSQGNRTIGICREVYSKWERRCPLTPSHVARLVNEHGMRVLVQPSAKRIFADQEFVDAGTYGCCTVAPPSAAADGDD
jgi:alpha-aminoadipic semialdehyde synthase